MTEIRDEQLRLREAVAALPDDDLLQMLRSPPEDYTPYALEVARQEITRRGGEHAIQQQIAEESSEEWRATATAEVAARPSKTILYGALKCAGGLVIFATTAQVLGDVARYAVAGAAILSGGLQLLRGVIQALWLRPTGTYIDPSDPLWQVATRQAQESIPTLRALVAVHLGDIMVKFPFVTDSGVRELVWGQLRAITDSTVCATIETSLIEHAGTAPKEVTIPVTELLDWHLDLPDGSIRGSYTTQAEILICKRLGLAAPRRIAALNGKFIDRLEQAAGS